MVVLSTPQKPLNHHNRNNSAFENFMKFGERGLVEMVVSFIAMELDRADYVKIHNFLGLADGITG